MNLDKILTVIFIFIVVILISTVIIPPQTKPLVEPLPLPEDRLTKQQMERLQYEHNKLVFSQIPGPNN